MANLSNPSLIAAAFLVFTYLIQPALAAVAPADPCSLLPATSVSKTLGLAYGAPQKKAAPRPYANTVEGTDCTYESSGNAGSLLFRVYFDHSPSEATDLFAKLKRFYSPSTPISGVGDEAYSDQDHALHARKGNVRFYLKLGDIDTGTAAKEKQLKDLGILVAGQLE